MYFISLNSLEYTFLTWYPFPSSKTAPGTVASHVITGSIISTLSCTIVTTTITVKAFCTYYRRRNFLNIFVKLFCYISKYGFKQFIWKIALKIHIMMRCFFHIHLIYLNIYWWLLRYPCRTVTLSPYATQNTNSIIILRLIKISW